MANNFQITITAVDKATAAVRKINQNLERMTRPVRQLQGSLRSLSKEVGLDKVGKSLKAVAQSARDVAAKFGSIVAPMMAVIGVGSIAGVVRLATEWGNFSQQLTNTAATIGISVDRLQSLRGEATLAGVSSDALTNGLKTLGNTMEDALYGRNQEALVMMNTLGIHMHRTASGAVDTNRAFRDLANVIAKVKNPQAQSLIARTFGLEEALPLLRKGSAGIAEYEARVKHFGATMSGPGLAAANKFQQSMLDMHLAIKGLQVSIAEKLFPVLGPLIERFAEWARKNRELIATKITEFIKRLADWLMRVNWDKAWKEVVRFTDKITNLVDALGGMKTVIWGVALAMSAGLVANILKAMYYLGRMTAVTIPAAVTALKGLRAAQAGGAAGEAAAGAGATASGVAGGAAATGVSAWLSRLLPFARGVAGVGMMFHSENLNQGEDAHMRKVREHYARAKAMAYFTKQGWTREQAAGIIANLSKESGLNSGAMGDNGKAYGIAQWHADRQAAFAKWAGHGIRGSSLDEQLGFVQYELTKGSEKHAGDLLRGANNAALAGAIVSRAYERPADAGGEAAQRSVMAAQINDDSSLQTAVQKHQVDIVLHGAPAGSQVSTRTSSPNVSSSARIGHTLPGVG